MASGHKRFIFFVVLFVPLLLLSGVLLPIYLYGSEDPVGELRGDDGGAGGGSGSEVVNPLRDARTVVEAFGRAYPDKVAETAFRNNDWAMRIGSQWFYWAEGRLLPEEALPDAANYRSYPFYPYSRELQPLREFTKTEAEELEQRLSARSAAGRWRHSGFMDALWEISDSRSGDAQTKTLYFLGRSVNVHRDLLEDLARVEKRIYEAAETDRELSDYIDTINFMTGYSWRNIASSGNRSLHSYGIAVDFLPASYDQAQVYWLWARESGLPWYNLPYEERLMPPASFVRFFEDEGFIWGGKWLYFDTMHFEYRPEILVINGLLGAE